MTAGSITFAERPISLARRTGVLSKSYSSKYLLSFCSPFEQLGMEQIIEHRRFLGDLRARIQVSRQ